MGLAGPIQDFQRHREDQDTDSMPLPIWTRNAVAYVPDGVPLMDALERTTHLGVGAHPDDLEFMAFHGIATCYRRRSQWFGGVVCADGRAAADKGRAGKKDLAAMRWAEQKAAARMGRYSFALQLNYPSLQVRKVASALVCDLKTVLQKAKPEVVYTHNPADKHPTHVGVCLAVVAAIRMLPSALRPRRVLGCEMWRGLDWLADDDKVILDVSGHRRLATMLTGVFKSQIRGGKRYDLAVEGRMRANATFLESHSPDRMEKAWYAMDLTPLARDDALDVGAFVAAAIGRFRKEVVGAFSRRRRTS
jgi:LmbE family N-acetylglucosaminyl deacetylase